MKIAGLKNVFHTIAGKFILLSAILIIAPLLITTVFYLHNYDETTKVNVADITDNILTVMNNHVDYMLQDVVDTSSFLMTSQSVQEALQNPLFDNYGNAYSSNRYNEVDQILINLTNNKTYVAAIYMGNENMTFYRYKTNYGLNMQQIYSGEPDPAWLVETKQARGQGRLFNATESKIFRGNMIVYTQIVNHLYHLHPIGLLVVGLDKSALDRIVLDMKSSLPIGVVIRQNGKIIYSFDNFNAHDTLEASYTELLHSEDGFYVSKDNNKFYFSQKTSNRAGWEVTVVTGYDSYEVNKQNLIRISLTLVAAAFTVELLGSMFITRSITEQLMKLRKYIGDLRENKTANAIIFTRKDEVSLIGNEFMNVVKENEKLIANLYEAKFREKEAELISLQAQINPHFLYNTLDTIFWIATDSQQQQIADIAISLAKLFRLSLNNGEQITDIASELEIIEHYVKIQNVRYDNRFSVTYHIPEHLYSCKIIKFMLQPIIENSIYHGLEKKEGKGFIDITAYHEDEFLYIVVTDDGVGFESKQKDVAKSGYAIRNIQKRIQLYYGNGCGLLFDAAVGKGCKVTIKIKPDIKAPDETQEE